MGLTSALNTSLNGLVLNETSIDVLGNNIANAGTNGFKASSVLFSTQLARTFSTGSRPTATSGGTNPLQVGLGATVASITTNFTQGGVTNSSSPSDLAIQGDGFFILGGADGQVFSRAGNFTINSASELVSPEGLRVQGYGVDGAFNLNTTQLTDITIPLGNLNAAQQTQNVVLGGSLLPTGVQATQGTRSLSEALVDSTGPAAATGATLLQDLETAANPGTPLFAVGETVSYTPREGGRTLEPLELTVTAATTVSDLLSMMQNAAGIHTGGGIPDDPNKTPAPGQPGFDIVGGQIQVIGNSGTVNDLTLSVGDITADGISVPVSFTETHEANGESAITDFVVYDSLGQPLTLKMTTTLESRDSTSTTFRWAIESSDDSDADTAVASGTIVFDGQGRIVSGDTANFTIDRNDTAAVSPMQVTADFSRISGISSPTSGSTISLITQDGSDPGTLVDFVIEQSGVINGIFDNGIVRTLGQVAVAKFSNPQGLVQAGATAYQEGVASGAPVITAPGNFGAGTIRAGAIELSNTDIGKSLVDLIVASTNYRGNARVISSVQELVDELLVLGR